ncbi:hypothetical protein VTI74DRAFT_4855 [Chaetomium olivicolor]
MSASMINIDFGTRRGWGEALPEETPFCTLLTLLLVPDLLCTQCLAALDVLDFKTKVLKLGLSQDSNGCRLCALLLARFRATASASVIEIEYCMIPRYGYFITVFDIAFRRVGAKDWRANVVRLGIQKEKVNRDTDGDHPPMVYFESKIGPSTDSESSMAQVAKWFETCCEKHERCKPETAPTPFVPSRLLEISGSDERTMRIRLRERPTLPVEVRYATLSHCWGSVMPFKLKHELVKSCLNGISLDEISRVFRDAIRVAWRLKIQYIWIDSLCIIQDSLEDWRAESAQMGLVYRHGILNIAATGFSDGSNGLFVQRDPNILMPISLSIGTNHSSHGNPGEGREKRQGALEPGNYYLADTSVWKGGVDDSPLCGRGWVTQERALSVRTVHFGKEQLFWECLRENASEVLPKGMLRGTEIMDPKAFLVPGTDAKEKREERLQSLRKELLERKKFDDDLRARLKTFKDRMRNIVGSDYEDSDDECGSDDDMSDKVFAARMMAIRNGNLAVRKGTTAARKGTMPENVSSESSDSDSDRWSYDPDKPSKLTKRKPLKFSLKSLELRPQDFEDCDLNILDGLNIKGWKKFKAQLERWNIGRQANSVESRPIRGMPHELSQWVAIVKLFSRCSLSFSSDKLVAISGMAQTLAPKLNCDYVAGLWRKDLEHQLLWKVTQPRPAPEKNHTRGPSWTWASVDGAIDIPEWRGYFYNRIAGDITWMAKVDDVSVQLAETGKYGQAQSGILTLTGRLGVFRIVKNGPENSANDGDNQDTNRSPESKTLWIIASWDTQELAEKFGTSGPRTYVQHHSTYGTGKGARRSMHPLDIFFVPVRVMDADPDGHDFEQPMLTGLLLLPTGNKKGMFRRIGQFELSGHWIHPHEEAFESLSKSTVLLDNRLYVSKHKRGQYTIRMV